MDDGAFARMAEQNEARQREIDRREKSVELKAARNGARINVVLMLLLVVVFGAVALWPVTYGDISANPHQDASENLIIDRSDPENPQAWSVDDLDLMERKVWDGKGQFSGSFQYDLSLPGLPIAINGVTTVPVDLELISYRVDGGDTGFRIGFFDGTCLDSQGLSIDNLPENLRFNSVDSMNIGETVKVEFNVPAGNYCVIFEYLDPPVEQGYKATIDGEITSHFLQPMAAPIAAIFILMSIFALVGAHKTGKAWKKVAQPERPERKTTEEQVLEDADDQRGAMSEVGAQPDEEAQDPNAEFPPQPESTAEDQPTAQGAPTEDSPTQDAVIQDSPTQDAVTEDATAEVEYSDDELRALGWTDEQIGWHRQAEAQPEQATEEYTDEQLAEFGWTAEQIAQYRSQ
jgi:hypothetical protein